jgi:V/A-type H+-transporting ATPase subunit K
VRKWIVGLSKVNFAVGAAAVLMFGGLLFMAEKVLAQHEGAAVAAAPAEGSAAAAVSVAPPQVRCWAFMAAALATGLGSLAAGYAVSGVGTAALGAVAEKPELMGKSLIYVALAEGIAIYGLLISIIMLAKV